MKNKLKKSIVIVLIIATVISIGFYGFSFLYKDASAGEVQDESSSTENVLETEQTETYVESKEIIVSILQEEKACLYSGMIDSSGSCVGEGHYEVENENGTTCVFDGESYNQHFYTGNIENYPINYGNSNVKYVSYYSGELRKGKPYGKGTLVVSGTGGSDFTYTGSWLNGKYSGYGELVYSDPNMMEYKGNFKQGSFKPTFIELIDALCSPGTFEMSEGAREYLVENEEQFLDSSNTDNLYMGNGFNYDSYKLTGENPDNKCFNTSMCIVQAIEYPEEIFGIKFTEILGYAESGNMVYYGYYFGDSEGLSEGDRIRFTAYPIGYGPYNESYAGDQKAIRFVAYDISSPQ